MLDKFLMRDLDERRAAVRVGNDDLGARVADLERGARRLADERERVESELDRQTDEELAFSGQLLTRARAGDEEALSRLDDWVQTAEERIRNRRARADVVVADAEALEGEIGRWRGDRTRVDTEIDAIAATQTRRIATVAKVGLAAQLLTALIGLIPLGHASDRAAHAIHLEYYAAVAGIMPVLLIAGFVELAILALRPAVWPVLSFAFPAIVGGSAALVVLANHDSTTSTRFLTIWGLVATMASLILYVVMHTTSSSSR
jgi:hypothetical protein